MGSFILRWARPRLCHLKLFLDAIYPARRSECKHLIDQNAHITTPLRGYSVAMAGSSLTLSRRALARLLAAVPIVLAARRTIAQGAVWSMATEYPAATLSGEAIAFFSDRMAKEGSGKITIDPAYDAPRGLNSADIVAAICDGRLAAGDSFAGALGRIDPLFLLSSLPFVARGPAEAHRLLDAARGLYASRLLRAKRKATEDRDRDKGRPEGPSRGA